VYYEPHPVHEEAVQLPQPPEPLPEAASPPPFTDIPNTENIFWTFSLWQDGQNNFFRSEALRKYSSNFVLHWLH
jgi:hypothetical protein